MTNHLKGGFSGWESLLGGAFVSKPRLHFPFGAQLEQKGPETLRDAGIAALRGFLQNSDCGEGAPEPDFAGGGLMS